VGTDNPSAAFCAAPSPAPATSNGSTAAERLQSGNRGHDIEQAQRRHGQHTALAPLSIVCARSHQGRTSVTVTQLTGFAAACQEAMRAVLQAIGTRGEERRGHLSHAKLAVDEALHDAQSSEEWNLAEHLRRGIKDVETRVRDAS
jgi:hypothetical protein